MPNVIVVVRDGLVVGAYASDKSVSVDVLDYDNMLASDEESYEYRNYQDLERELKKDGMVAVY